MNLHEVWEDVPVVELSLMRLVPYHQSDTVRSGNAYSVLDTTLIPFVESIILSVEALKFLKER